MFSPQSAQPLTQERIEELKRLHTEYVRDGNQLLDKARFIARLIEFHEKVEDAA